MAVGRNRKSRSRLGCRGTLLFDRDFRWRTSWFRRLRAASSPARTSDWGRIPSRVGNRLGSLAIRRPRLSIVRGRLGRPAGLDR
ncbi:MAG: hypothetical protein NT069_03840, partial [Planctomycetota bacterium]|nr:hypothetical protein [Planctomycetota bacterium]